MFTRAYCSAPSCMPSRTSLMTGLNPSSCGIYDNIGAFWRENPYLAGIPTLPQAFRSEGYRTAGGGNFYHGLSWISDSYGTNQNAPASWDTYFPSLDKPMPDIVILWSDHTFHLGEKQTWEKFTLWKESGRVPLIIRAPGITIPSSRCDVPVSLLDIYPTLLDLCRLPAKDHLEGESLLP